MSIDKTWYGLFPALWGYDIKYCKSDRAMWAHVGLIPQTNGEQKRCISRMREVFYRWLILADKGFLQQTKSSLGSESASGGWKLLGMSSKEFRMIDWPTRWLTSNANWTRMNLDRCLAFHLLFPRITLFEWMQLKRDGSAPKGQTESLALPLVFKKNGFQPRECLSRGFTSIPTLFSRCKAGWKLSAPSGQGKD